MTLAMKSAAEISILALAELFNLSFTGYIGGTIHLDRASMLGMLTRDNIDLSLSHLLVRDETLLGLILIARQGWTSRIAGMGIIPEAQNQGLGKWFLAQVISQARSRRERSMILEAFEQNTPAVELYKRSGFAIVRRLIGYDAPTIEGIASPDVEGIDIYDLAKIVIQHGSPDLPWQVSGTAIARVGAPNRAYRLGHAYALISNPAADTIVLRALITAPEFRRQGEATCLVWALAAMFPDKKWMIVQLCPEEYDPFLLKFGFIPKALNQVQMHLDLGE